MAILALAVWVGPPTRAAETEKKVAGGAKDTLATAQGQDPKMSQWAKYATPGTNHAYLEPFIGKWTHTVRWWMEPQAKPEQSQGTTENSWILGKRFLQGDVKGMSMGQPFEGIGITGYDNVRGEFTSMWMDNMGTGVMQGAGHYNAATKAIIQEGTYACPMTGEKNKAFRSIWKVIDSDHHTYEMYTPGPDGKEFKSLDIGYQRVK